MEILWAPHRFPMEILWTSDKFPTEILWKSDGNPIDFLWEILWKSHRFPLEIPIGTVEDTHFLWKSLNLWGWNALRISL